MGGAETPEIIFDISDRLILRSFALTKYAGSLLLEKAANDVGGRARNNGLENGRFVLFRLIPVTRVSTRCQCSMNK
jgi:hypothetical protein